MPVTPNIGLQTPPIGSTNWGTPLNFDLDLLDQIFGGTKTIPALNVTETITAGTVTAGTFSGLDGAYFLQSSIFNQPNGIPQLNSGGLIPSALVSNQGVSLVTFTTTPVFNAANGQGFKMILTGNVTSSTFVNGAQGSSLVIFRLVQDSVGSRTFTWPTNVRNAMQPSPTPNSRSVQIFALDTDGSLDAIGPMFYS